MIRGATTDLILLLKTTKFLGLVSHDAQAHHTHLEATEIELQVPVGLTRFQILTAVNINTLKPHWLLHIPPTLTYQNSTFCPQSVFVCSVW
jgi:hypothetical protein